MIQHCQEYHLTALTPESVDEFVDEALRWVEGHGVQVIGACCGFGPNYIQPLREKLPERTSFKGMA